MDILNKQFIVKKINTDVLSTIWIETEKKKKIKGSSHLGESECHIFYNIRKIFIKFIYFFKR